MALNIYEGGLNGEGVSRMYRLDFVPEPSVQGGSITGESGFPLRGGHAHITMYQLPGD